MRIDPDYVPEENETRDIFGVTFEQGRNTAPVIDEEKCKQCLLCVPVCPDSCIAVKENKRQPIDYDHCKGCGICIKACPFNAITMEVKSNE